MKIPSKNIFITNNNSIKLKSTNETSVISNRNSIKESKELAKDKLTENFFDYLINESSNYANFEKVTEYYENKLRKNKKIHDENLAIIQAKKEELANIKIHIYNIILNNIKLEDQNIDLYYEKIIDKYKKDITLTKHELEVYKNSYNEIYKKNYNLNSRLENEGRLEKIFEEQYDKYINIKEASLNKLMKQEDMLQTLKYYFEKCKEINKKLISKKEKKLKQLNYEIHVLKEDEVKNEEKLKNLLEGNDNLNIYIQNRRKRYALYSKELKLVLKNYINDMININKIYEYTKEKNIDNIIYSYNKLKNENKQLSGLFSLKSKKIINLNYAITTLNNEHDFILRSIKIKRKAEKEETKNNIMNHNDSIEQKNLEKNMTRNFIIEKNDILANNLKLLINTIASTLKLIFNINHSRNITICSIEALPYPKRDELIQKFQNYFDNIFTHRYKINLENHFLNKKFLKFVVCLLKELNFQIKSIISNVYQILNERKKEKISDQKRRLSLKIELLNNTQTLGHNKKQSSDKNSENNKIIITNFNIKELQKAYDEELKIKINKLEERKKFFEFEEQEFFKKKLKNGKKYKEDENNIIQASKELEGLNRNRSNDCISTKEFINNYYKYLNNQSNISEFSSVNNSTKINKNPLNINKINFMINYTNDFVSDRKEYEDKKFEKFQRILIKSKKIKEENEKQEISRYIKKNAKVKKLIRDQYKKNISTDSEKEEKDKKEELALQIITKELAELKKPKKYLLKLKNKETSKIYERFDDLRALELNFIKNKGNFMIDSGFFNEYYFKLKKQFNENQLKAKNMKYKFNNVNNKNNILNRNYKINNLSNSVKNLESAFSERSKSYRNFDDNRKKIFLKKINKKCIIRNNSEILFNNLENNNSNSPKKL